MIEYFSFKEIMIGPIKFQVWGLMVSIGFLSMLILSLREAKSKNINSENIWDALVLSFAGMIVGARILYVISNPNEFTKLTEVIDLRSGGFSFLGGAIMAALFVFFYAKFKKIDIWKLGDTFTIGFIWAIIIVRMGCFLIYDHVGKITNLPWGREYIDQTLRHPVALYIIFSGLAIFFVIWYLKKRSLKQGTLFLLFILFYLILSFLIDFLRCDDLFVCDNRIFNLTYMQWFSLFAIPFATYLFYRRKNNFK